MKRYLSIVIVIPFMLILSVTVFATPSLPSFISGTSITVPYQAADSQSQTFLNSFNSTSMYPYLVAVSNSLEIGISSSEFLIESSGKYQYLHFIKPGSLSEPIQFYTPSNYKSSMGVWTGSGHTIEVLTFQYDMLTGTFDGGTFRKVPRGVLFDYIIDSSVLTEPTTVYPNFGKIGCLTLTPPFEHPGYGYFLQIKSAEVPTYKITVKYVYENGNTAASTVEQGYPFGYAYNIVSPAIAGYYPSQSEIKGNIGESDLNFTITYKKNDAYQNNAKKLTIRYIFEDGSQAWTPKNSNCIPGYLYSVISPHIPGFAADRLIVEGYMPGYDYVETVTFKRIEHGLPDPPKYYYLTINYLRRNGQMITRETTLMLLPGTKYNEKSPVFSYYKPDKTYVFGTMPEQDIIVNVYYDETDSPNTGEGDKDDGTGGNTGG